MKWTKTKIVITLGIVLLSSLLTWALYLYCNKQYYGQFFQYSGKAKIDDYELFRTVRVLLFVRFQQLQKKSLTDTMILKRLRRFITKQNN